ncbi:diiron oxygenase [Crossiella sp. CA198]|uniref:diiron oxygenase n=1 Tax=Crossiella sp. CA198 TaxID=3455607 RepID=UPI003F8D6D10
MSTRRYALPVEQTKWSLSTSSTVVFDWDYDPSQDRLLGLYERGKAKQWDANERIDWSIPFDPTSPEHEPDHYLPLFGSPVFERMTQAERNEYRHHVTAFNNSMFLHGEQGALICAARVVETVPELDAKFYAATQVVDEARHVEIFSRLVREKIELAYPISAPMKELLTAVLEDPRPDIVQLGMQVLIEGLALAAFALGRDSTTHPLFRTINAYVMQDEARHVAFGRIGLRDLYRQLTAREIAEREEFVVEACHLMRDRLMGEEVFERLGLPVRDCLEHVEHSPFMRGFRSQLFSRIVPAVQDIGLCGPKVRRAFEDMGVIQFEAVDLDATHARDDRVADEVEAADAARVAQVAATIEAGEQ